MLSIFANLVAKQQIKSEDLLSWINAKQILYTALISKFEEFAQAEQVSRILAYTALTDFFSELTPDKDIPTKFMLQWTETTDQEVVSKSQAINFTEEAVNYLKLISKECRTVVAKLSKEGISFNIAEALTPLTQQEKQIKQSTETSQEDIQSHIQQEISEQGIAKVSQKYFGDGEGFFYPIYFGKEQAKVIKVIKTLYISRPTEELRQVAVNTFLYTDQEVRGAKLKIVHQAVEDCWQQVRSIEALPQVGTGIVEKYQARKVLQKLMNISLFLNAELVNYRKDTLHLSLEEYIKRGQIPFIQLDSQEKAIIEKIKIVENKFLQLVGCRASGWSWEEDIAHKKILEQIRAEAKKASEEINIDKGNLTAEEVQQVRGIYQQIAADIKQKLLPKLIEKALSCLGNPPGSPSVNFAILGLGSLAREEMTPYSDFEFAILIKEDTSEIREYFYHFSALINFMVMNLGETVIPEDTFKISFEDVINPGFQLDLGGKTPLGRLNQNYELIQTPAKMAEYVREEAFKRAKLMPMEMSTYTYIYGNPALGEEYQTHVEQELNKTMCQVTDKTPEGNVTSTVRQARALRSLSNDANEFDPNLHNANEEGKLLKVKQGIYRLPNTILEGLALYYGINGTFNTWSKIEELCKTGKVSKEGGLHLQEVFSIATYLRLTVYQKYHAQNEAFSVLFSLIPICPNLLMIPDKSSEYVYYKFSSQQTKVFTEIYKVLIPLHKAVDYFVNEQEKTTKLAVNPFYDETHEILGKIASRLCDYEEAEKQFKMMTEKDPENAVGWHRLGIALVMLRKKEGMVEALERALELVEEEEEVLLWIKAINSNLGTVYGNLGNVQKQNDLSEGLYERVVKLKANILGNLGCAYGCLGELQKKKEILERSLTIEKEFYGDEHVEIATTLMNLGNVYIALGNFQKAENLLKSSLKIKEKFYAEHPEHIEIAIILNSLGNAYGGLGNYQKQKELLESALKISENFYGDEHIEIARILVNLGNAYGRLGGVQKKKDSLERALMIQEKFYAKHLEHIEVAKTLHDLGNVYGDLDDFQQKKDLLKHALRITERFYSGSEHPDMAIILDDLGGAYVKLGAVQKGKDSIEHALKILEKFYGPEHVEVARTLNNLGNAYRGLGDNQKNKDVLERALEIKEKLYGPEHIEVAGTLGNLGNAYGDLGNVQKQKELLERALCIFKKSYGSDHIEVTKTCFNLGEAHQSLGDNKQARQYFSSAYKTFLSFYGPNNVNAQKACQALADCSLVDSEMELQEILLLASNSRYKSTYLLKHFGDICCNAGSSPGGLWYYLQAYSICIKDSKNIKVLGEITASIRKIVPSLSELNTDKILREFDFFLFKYPEIRVSGATVELFNQLVTAYRIENLSDMEKSQRTIDAAEERAQHVILPILEEAAVEIKKEGLGDPSVKLLEEANSTEKSLEGMRRFGIYNTVDTIEDASIKVQERSAISP